MAKILFIDIPVLEEALEEVVALRFKAQDIINIQCGVDKPLQKHRKQFTRGILQLSAFLKKHSSHEVVYYDHQSMETAKFEADVLTADWVGIAGNNTAYFHIVQSIARQIRQLSNNISIVLGGYHATALDEEILRLNDEIDFVIRGEAELPLLELMNGVETSRINSLTYRINGTIRQNPLTKPLPSQEIQLPDYSLLPEDPNLYNYNIQSVRGCVYRCSFCSNGYFWNSLRTTPLKDVILELEILDTILTPGTVVHISDNILSLNVNRTERLLRAIRKRKMGLKFSCDLKANHVTEKLVRSLDRSNFVKISLGYEDADNAVLMSNNKGLTFEDNVKASRIIRANSNIMIEAYWIIGLPGSTHVSMRHNLERIKYLLRENIVDVISSSLIYTPLPGTPIFTYPDSYGLTVLTYEWDRYLRNYFEPVYELSTMNSDELKSYFHLYEEVILREYCEIHGINASELENQ
jgi:anaerobic magnesium-protoporphyrin IX monomethyl ester cyclase